MTKSNNNPKQKKMFSLVFVLCSIIFLLVVFLMSSYFDIIDIEIIGNNNVSVEDIKYQMGINEGDNIFSSISLKAAKNLEKIPFIKEAKIKKIYPNKLVVEIFERKPRAYVERENLSSFILIDNNGLVLSVEPSVDVSRKIPVIVGLSFSDIVLGEILKTENEVSFKNAVLFSRLFEKYEMQDIVKLEISDDKNIHIYVDRVDVFVGDITNIDEKIRTLKQCIIDLENVIDDPRGFLDISDINTEPVFKHLK